MHKLEAPSEPNFQPTHLEQILGIQDDRLTNTNLMAQVAKNIGQPDLEMDFLSVGEQRKNVRALDIVAQLAGLTAIGLVASSKIDSLSHLPPLLLVGAGLFAMQIILRQELGARSTDNDNTIATALSGVSTTIKEMKLGQIGEDASLAAERAATISAEERFIHGRPTEMNLGEALSWVILTLSSDNKLATLGVGAVNTMLSYAQTWLVNSHFAKKNAIYQEASHQYIRNLKDHAARAAYKRAKKEKKDATRPINFISTGLSSAIILFSKIPFNTMAAGLMAKAVGFFTGVATRSISINEAKERQKLLNNSMRALLQELSTFIKSPEALQKHIEKTKDASLPPKDLAAKLQTHHITDALIADVQIEHNGENKERRRIIFDFSHGSRIKVLAGGNGAGKTTLRRVITHEKDNHVGWVGAVQGENIRDVHDSTFTETATQFPYWTSTQDELPGSNFLDKSKLDIAQIKDLTTSIPELAWLNDERIYSTELNNTQILSNGERRILSLIAFIENHKQSAHTIWLDEIYAELSPTNIKGLQKYMELTGARFVVIQQEAPNTATFDVTYLTQGQDYTSQLGQDEWDALCFFEASSHTVTENPLVAAQIWQNNPLEFVKLLSQHNADAIQLLIDHATVFGENNFMPLLSGIEKGLIELIKATYQNPTSEPLSGLKAGASV